MGSHGRGRRPSARAVGSSSIGPAQERDPPAPWARPAEAGRGQPQQGPQRGRAQERAPLAPRARSSTACRGQPEQGQQRETRSRSWSSTSTRKSERRAARAAARQFAASRATRAASSRATPWRADGTARPRPRGSLQSPKAEPRPFPKELLRAPWANSSKGGGKGVGSTAAATPRTAGKGGAKQTSALRVLDAASEFLVALSRATTSEEDPTRGVFVPAGVAEPAATGRAAPEEKPERASESPSSPACSADWGSTLARPSNRFRCRSRGNRSRSRSRRRS